MPAEPRKAFVRVNSNNEEPRHSKVRKGTGFITKAKLSASHPSHPSGIRSLLTKGLWLPALRQILYVQAMMMDILSKVDDEAPEREREREKSWPRWGGLFAGKKKKSRRRRKDTCMLKRLKQGHAPTWKSGPTSPPGRRGTVPPPDVTEAASHMKSVGQQPSHPLQPEEPFET